MSEVVIIDYTNYKGERRKRRIVPKTLTFGTTEHHPDPQYFLYAFDVEKDAFRTFAMKDIHSWESAK